MRSERQPRLSRRDLFGAASVVGTASLLGLRPDRAAAEPPETTTIRLIYDPNFSSLCYAPMFVASPLLRAEGFTDVRYVTVVGRSAAATVGAGRADMTAAFPPTLIAAIDKGLPLVGLMGLHVGCYEVFGTGSVRTIRDLKGKRVLSDPYGLPEAVFLANILAYVGIDPRNGVQWVPHPPGWPDASIRLLAAGKVDAMTATPPGSQRTRAARIGHLVLSTVTDPPWSQYTCCVVSARREFVERYPVATKRALRAIVKATQLCTSEPERAARFLVDERFNRGASYEEALTTVREMRYGAVWRDYDPEAALLFHALRMRENGFITSAPQQIIARGTDWRFLNELKRELKA